MKLKLRIINSLSSKLWCYLSHDNSIIYNILRTGNYQQISNEIMTNPDGNQKRDHINARVSFNFIHYMANLLGSGGAKWQNGSLLHHFKNKIRFTKKSCFCLKFFIFYVSLIVVCIFPPHALSAAGNRFLKNGAWSRMSNFLKPQQKFEMFSQSWWNYRFQRFERKFSKYSEER